MRSLTFFQFIKFYFGFARVSRLKKWIRLRKCLTKLTLRINFLRKCIIHNVTPAHLIGSTKYHNMLYNGASRFRCNRIMNRFVRDMLKNEIRDTYVHINSLRREILHLVQLISMDLPTSISNRFFIYQNKSQRLYYELVAARLNKKFDWLSRKQDIAARARIRPIRYYYASPIPTSDNDGALVDSAVVKYSLNPIEHSHSSPQSIVSLDPLSFIPLSSPVGLVNDKWFINLSSHNIPHEVQVLLQLGEKFCVPIINKELATIDLLKNVECNINRLPAQARQTIRNRSFSIINKFHKSSTVRSPIDKQVLHAFKTTKQFIAKNPNILFTRADKGNVTVAMDRSDYLHKMLMLLADNNTYVIVNKNPIRKLIGSLHDLLVRWKSRDYISNSVYKALNCTDGTLPRAYGLPKIHKQNSPLRIIVSSKYTPLYRLAKFLQDIIKKSIPRPNSQISNSLQVVGKLTGLHMPSDFKLISLDVISLFTNIPLDMAIDSIVKRWDHIEKICTIPRDEFIIAIRFIMNSTFFTFNDVCYQQTFGTPMGSPLSPIIADITLQDLENRAIGALSFSPLFYIRYVDDIALAAPSSTLDKILNIFNSYHPRLQFTMEEGVGNRLNFLDVTIISSNGVIQFDWFQKATFSGRYLHFESRHPLCHKRGIVIGLTDKVLHLSHPRFHQKNFELIINILINNGYPIPFIFHTINERLKKVLSTNNGNLDNKTYDCVHVTNTRTDNENDDTEDNTGTNKITYLNIPYIKNISEQFYTCVKDLNIRMSYTGINNLRTFIRVGKDKLQKYARSNIVYKINCNNCDASYVGQTSRMLNTRIKEHKNNRISVLAHHKLLNHDFKWDEVEILDEEPFLSRRLMSEMIHIKRQKNALNLQSDTFRLNDACLPIIDGFSKI